MALTALPLAFSTLSAQNTRPQITYHWHLHQPIYWNDRTRVSSTDRYEYAWESIQMKDGGSAYPTNNLREIFGKDDRWNVYQHRATNTINNSLRGLPNGGAQISYSGALIENVQSLANAGQLNYYQGWQNNWINANSWTTSTGDTRADIVNFSYHHALLPLHDEETIYMEIRLHQEKVRQTFGEDALSRGTFPTELAFSTRLIPIYERLGIEWSFVSGEKIARAMPDFPVEFGTGGVNTNPPNPADFRNPPGGIENFIRRSAPSLGCSPVNHNPISFQPAYSRYVDPNTGEVHTMMVIPVDQSLSWADGFSPLGADFLEDLEGRNDPNQPSLVVLCHDGDNAWGGGASYYEEAVPGLAGQATSRGNAMTTVESYLSQFPPSPDRIVHVEDGGWVNPDADFGSPTFIQWNYPPLNSSGQPDPENGWHYKMRDYGIFSASLNMILTAQQIHDHEPDFAQIMNPGPTTHPIDRAWHYYLGSLDSGNVYYGAVEDFIIKGSLGNIQVHDILEPLLQDLTEDETPPTIWIPQRFPYNPGGLNFGSGHGYQVTGNDGDFHIYTFIHDVSGPVEATLRIRIDDDGVIPLDSIANHTYEGGEGVGEWIDIPMTRRVWPLDDPYPFTNLPQIQADLGDVLPREMSDYFWAEVTDLREVLIDYYVEAVDTNGNVARSPIQHVYIGEGVDTGGPGGGSGAVTLDPEIPDPGDTVTITYDASGSVLSNAEQVFIHIGQNGFLSVLTPDPAMTPGEEEGTWVYNHLVPEDAFELNMVFNNGAGTWDNNNGFDWTFETSLEPFEPDPRVVIIPDPAIQNQDVTISFDPNGGPLAAESNIFLHYGYNGWEIVLTDDTNRPQLSPTGNGRFEVTVSVPGEVTEINMVFTNNDGIWDNNNGNDWAFDVIEEPEPPVETIEGFMLY